MSVKKVFALLPFLALPFISQPVNADAFIKAEDTVEYRQHAFSMIRDNFGILAGMVRGEIKYDAARFQQHATSLQHLTHLPLPAFTGVGEGVTTDSAALPAIWQKWSDFEKKMNALINAANELAVAAESNNIRTIAPKFMATAATCKQCHDNYRAK